MDKSNSTIAEIREMYEKIQEKATSLVVKLDRDEQALQETAHDLFIEAVKTVIPVIKYIEVDLGISEVCLRGIWIDEETALVRDGVILHKKDPSKGQHYSEWWNSTLHGDEFIDWVIKCLENMAKAFQDALTKIESRQKSLTDRQERLTKAAVALKQD